MVILSEVPQDGRRADEAIKLQESLGHVKGRYSNEMLGFIKGRFSALAMRCRTSKSTAVEMRVRTVGHLLLIGLDRPRSYIYPYICIVQMVTTF